MNVIGNFLVNETIGAVETTPIVGPLVITPARLSLQAISSIARASISLLAVLVALTTFGCLILTIGIRVLSSLTSSIYHLFASLKKSP